MAFHDHRPNKRLGRSERPLIKLTKDLTSFLHKAQRSLMHDTLHLPSRQRGFLAHILVEFAEDLKAHGGDPAQVRHVCMDMSAAYAKGVALALPEAQISYDRFHVVSMAIDAMDQVRRAEMATDAQAVRAANNLGLLKS